MSSSSDDWGNGRALDQWLTAARQGSQEALGNLLKACQPYLLAVANQELPSDIQGKVGPSDLVQETLVRALQGFPRFQGQTQAELLAWLRRILLNHLTDVTQRHRLRIGQEVSLQDSTIPWAGGVAEPAPGPGSDAIARETSGELRQALEKLPEHYRQVIELRHQEQLSFEAIGQRMKRSAGAARKLWARAIEQLQELLPPADSS